jgi:hypothetical protein
MGCVFRAFQNPKVLGVTAGSHVAHVVNLIAVRDVTVVHLEDSAVEHFHLTVMGAVIAPRLPEVTVSIQFV